MAQTLDEILALAEYELSFLSGALEPHLKELMTTPSGGEAYNLVALAKFVIARTRDELRNGARPGVDHSALHAALDRMRRENP